MTIFQLDFQLASEEGDTGTFIPNGEWALLGKMTECSNTEIPKTVKLPRKSFSFRNIMFQWMQLFFQPFLTNIFSLMQLPAHRYRPHCLRINTLGNSKCTIKEIYFQFPQKASRFITKDSFCKVSKASMSLQMFWWWFYLVRHGRPGWISLFYHLTIGQMLTKSWDYCVMEFFALVLKTSSCDSKQK